MSEGTTPDQDIPNDKTVQQDATPKRAMQVFQRTLSERREQTAAAPAVATSAAIEIPQDTNQAATEDEKMSHGEADFMEEDSMSTSTCARMRSPSKAESKPPSKSSKSSSKTFSESSESCTSSYESYDSSSGSCSRKSSESCSRKRKLGSQSSSTGMVSDDDDGDFTISNQTPTLWRP